jgi:hypothetical protein
MLDTALDNAIADHKTYGSVEVQHRMFGRLRREDPIYLLGDPMQAVAIGAEVEGTSSGPRSAIFLAPMAIAP